MQWNPAMAAVVTTGLLFVLSTVATGANAVHTVSGSQPHTSTRPVASGPLRLYVGTYTSPKSKGIYLLDFDPASGSLGSPRLAGEARNPSFLAMHPNQRVLYAVNEIDRFAGHPTGAVSAFAISPESGGLTLLNQQPSGGTGPCHVAVDPGGHCVLVANYGGGTVATLPIDDDGWLGKAASIADHRDRGPHSGQSRTPRAHSMSLDPGQRFAFAPDLGMDTVFAYRFNGVDGALTPNEPPGVAVAPGSGPRHMAWHPGGRFAYVINEKASTVAAFAYDSERGSLRELQTISTLPEGFKETTNTAEVQVHPSGRFLYGSNRGHDSIAVFAIDQDTGRLALVCCEPTGGKAPRHFAIDPSGIWLLAANQKSDTIVVFRVEANTGRPKPTGVVIEVPSPVCLCFAALPR